MNNKAVYITHAKRTATGSLLGSLSQIPAPKLGASVIKSIMHDSGVDPISIDEVILGQVLTGGAGQNPARQSSVHAGLPNEVPALTINKVCGSGLKAVFLSASAILAGIAELMIAGGQENMSLGLHGSYVRSGQKLGDVKMLDLMQYDGLTDAFSGVAMGITAENIAKKFGITREMQDQFAYDSHRKAAAARDQGRFKNEIVPLTMMQKKEQFVFETDEGIRDNTSIELLARLRPAFDPSGTVTAGNSSTINDGSAAVLVASEEALKKYNLKPLVRIVSYASAGVDPNFMGIGPVPASRKALAKAGWTHSDLDLIECNEAFAAQGSYVNKEMGWDEAKVNVNGGAIALGHPIGASGARVLVTLVHQMIRQKAKKGLVTMCIGGGMGVAMCIENCEL